MRGFRGGREETVAERARLSLETAMFFLREGKARRYLCAMSSTGYRGPDARGSHATVPNRTYHLHDAIPFTVNLPLTHTLGSILAVPEW
jgi:hypothetical protein